MNTFGTRYLEPGMYLTFHKPWYVRLWRWFRRVVLRRKDPVFVVTKVDHETSTITVEGSGCQ